MATSERGSQAHMHTESPSQPNITTPAAHPDTALHLAAFFAQYPKFEYRPTRPVMSEFNRMKRVLKWGKNARKSSRALARLYHALVLQFNHTYGTDTKDLASWQKLCRAMRITNIPESLSACKKLVDTIYVNLVDLIDMPNTGMAVRLFKTEAALSAYTKDTEKILPRDDADAGALLKRLLRFIWVPRRQKKTKAKASTTLEC